MDPGDEAALDTVSGAFADCLRPPLIRDPSHCSECAAADRHLASLDRADLVLHEIDEREGFDYFSMMTDAGFRYLLPALCRIALQERPLGLSHFLLRMDRAHKAVTEPHHRIAICEFLDYLATMGYPSSDGERAVLRKIRARVHMPQGHA